MRGIGRKLSWCLAATIALALSTLAVHSSSDVNADGYVGRADSVAITDTLQMTCLAIDDSSGNVNRTYSSGVLS